LQNYKGVKSWDTWDILKKGVTNTWDVRAMAAGRRPQVA
jgi:hypothetical protein